MTDYAKNIAGYLSRTGYDRFVPRAALIDMDGTLYDSMPYHARAWERLMKEYGIECPPEEFLLYEGMTGEATIRYLFKRDLGRDVTSEEAAAIYHRKTEYFSEIAKIVPMPGADRMLSTLRSHGITRVVVTGSGQRSIIDRIDHEYPGMFPAGMVITARDVTHGKPHPEPYLRGMTLAAVEPWQSIVIENAPLGVEAGVASGAFTVGITTGPLPAQALADAGADIIFPSMPEFADELPHLLDALSDYR
ncbi:MAG: HAD-IA family hydrolase [Paramuribaculum sp.]|nr:HAD-IA family hydrolase [Paramuribaculum sp.]